MSYELALSYLLEQLPMYQRQGSKAIKKGLGNITKLCEWTNNPQNKLNCIHIAGTNGKGSLAHILSAVLQTAGLKIGIYTSPHLLDFRERIRINNKKVNKEYVSAFVNKYRAEMENTGASFFELSVAMAFDYFASKYVVDAIIETG